MPKTKPHPSRPQTITFNDADHTYIDSDGLSYESVTTLVHRYAQPFDGPAIARAKAERETPQEGKTVDEWRQAVERTEKAFLASWTAKRTMASTYGTNVHRAAESIINGTEIAPPKNEDEKYAFAKAWDYIATMREAPLEFYSEVIVFSPRLYIAGTVDLIAYNRENGVLHILDWKTNEEIKYQGFREEAMQAPLEHLQDCNYEHYSLQLALYAYILQSEGYLRYIADDAQEIRTSLLWIPPRSTGGGVEHIMTANRSLEMRDILLHNINAEIDGVPF